MKCKIISTIILLFFFIGQFNAQERLITGKITDIKGNPLAGVTVTAKDYPSLTTISGVDGEFRIEVFDFTKALLFTFSGMKTKEVVLGDLDRLLTVMEFMPMKNPDPWSVIFNINSGQSHVYNEAKNNNPDWEHNGEPGFSSSLEIEYFITQNIGIGTGIGYNAYNSSSFLNDFTNVANNISRTDQDGDQYYLYNIGSSIEERVMVRTLSVPVKLKFRFRPGKKWNYYADLGLKMMNTLSAINKAQGRTEWQAYYPAYHVVIYDVVPYGYTNYDINSENSLIDYEKFLFSIVGIIGVSRRIKKELNLDFGLFFEQGLNDLKYDKPVHPADFLNTIGAVDKTIIRAMGFTVGLRYHLTKKR